MLIIPSGVKRGILARRFLGSVVHSGGLRKLQLRHHGGAPPADEPPVALLDSSSKCLLVCIAVVRTARLGTRVAFRCVLDVQVDMHNLTTCCMLLSRLGCDACWGVMRDDRSSSHTWRAQLVSLRTAYASVSCASAAAIYQRCVA